MSRVGGRVRRSARVGWEESKWPPRAKSSWVEVMVVVDGPMVKYHSSTGVRHYVLTLMHIVSKPKMH